MNRNEFKVKRSIEFKDFSKDLLTHGYAIRTNARGLSMFPYIWTGDKITISPARDIKPADIIVFTRNAQLVCHTVVRMREKNGIKHYETRGDSSFGPDEPVTSKEVLGKVTRIERGNMPFVRRILLFMSPVLRAGRLNAVITSSLTRIRNRFPRRQTQFSRCGRRARP